MKASSKTKKQLIDEIATLQARNTELEAMERRSVKRTGTLGRGWAATSRR